MRASTEHVGLLLTRTSAEAVNKQEDSSCGYEPFLLLGCAGELSCRGRRVGPWRGRFHIGSEILATVKSASTLGRYDYYYMLLLVLTRTLTTIYWWCTVCQMLNLLHQFSNLFLTIALWIRSYYYESAFQIWWSWMIWIIIFIIILLHFY